MHSLHNSNTAKEQHNVKLVEIAKYHKQQNLLWLKILSAEFCYNIL